MSTLAQRMAECERRNPQVTRAVIARAAKVKSPSVTDWFNGKTKSLKSETARRAAALFGCDQNWLATGVGAPGWLDAPTTTQAHQQVAEFGPGAEAAPDQARQRLLERLRTADEATVRLVELALLDDKDNGAAAARLSPSLRGLVGFLKQQIAAEIASHDNT